MEFRPVQSENADLPIQVTLLGMVMEFRPVQPMNAEFPIPVTLLGITVFLHPVISVLYSVSMIALQLFRESKTEFPFSTWMDVKLQNANASLPIYVTLLGIVMDVRLQNANARELIFVTLY